MPRPHLGCERRSVARTTVACHQRRTCPQAECAVVPKAAEAAVRIAGIRLQPTFDTEGLVTVRTRFREAAVRGHSRSARTHSGRALSRLKWTTQDPGIAGVQRDRSGSGLIADAPRARTDPSPAMIALIAIFSYVKRQ
eukprot:2567616-Pleurochrysis_carterae.AAC.1